MHRIRAFEETAMEAQKAGEILGPLHVSIGQEAVAAGICLSLRRDDRLTSNHRGHGHALAKGADPKGMMAELHGRAAGSCGGKGGSMHIADFSVGMLGANGVVAGGIPIAVGAAQGLKLLGSNAIVACFFGDGAANRGPFLEGLNWAALYRLPVLFVCEDNGVAAFTEAASVTAGPGISARAESLGVPAVAVDGNDVLAVDEAAAALVASVRRGDAPGCCSPTLPPPRAYLDGSSRLARGGRGGGSAGRRAHRPARRGAPRAGRSEAELRAVADGARAEMDEARRQAREAPWPEAALAYGDVQDTGAPAWTS
jgi:pyruvate dehydrogenase E1 component alpha subunit